MICNSFPQLLCAFIYAVSTQIPEPFCIEWFRGFLLCGLSYLKKHHRVLYGNLLTSGKLNSYLVDIDRQAEEMFERLVKQMAEREGVTEQLKVANSMEWVRKMNSIRNRAVEITNSELIYA